MNPKAVALLASYARHLGATILVAIFATGKLPTDFTAGDWATVANAVWVSVIPVVIRWLNPKDKSFGKTTD